MTNAEIIAAVNRWQTAPVHPLTCGTDSNHRVLVPLEQAGTVILACPECDYRQAIAPTLLGVISRQPNAPKSGTFP